MIHDWRGTEIEVGATVVYAVKHSTAVENNEATVIEIDVSRKDWYDRPEPRVLVEWSRSSRYGDSRKLGQKFWIKLDNLTVFKKIAPEIKPPPPDAAWEYQRSVGWPA